MGGDRSSGLDGFVTSNGNCFWIRCLTHAWNDLRKVFDGEIIIEDSN